MNRIVTKISSLSRVCRLISVDQRTRMTTPTPTFQNQEKLPSLPVPDLKETGRSYYDSAEIFLDEDQKKATKAATEKFLESKHVKEAHASLELRAKEKEPGNWLEEWWNDTYLETRAPLIPFRSIGGVHPRAKPMGEGFQLVRAAEVIHELTKIWLSLRREKFPLPVTKNKREIVMDMHAYYVSFNANRTPQKDKDVLTRPFRLGSESEGEGTCPSHVTVICAGHLWAVETLDGQGEVLPVEAIYHQIVKIHNSSHESPNPHPLSALTAANRDFWADMRSHVMEISEGNASNLLKVEESTFCLCLTDRDWGEGDVDNQLLHYSIAGDCTGNWADKTFNVHIHKDSRMTSQTDHSNTDGIAPFDIMDRATKAFRQSEWTPDPENVEGPDPRQLTFQIDDVVKEAIIRSREGFDAAARGVNVKKVEVTGHGSDRFRNRKSKVQGDTVIQMALQLAFFKTHNKIAPALEGATLGKFYHGRAEIVRACTKELKNLVEDIDKDDNPVSDAQKILFKKAYDKHNDLVHKAMNMEGVDKHLLGIRKAIESIGDLPELYTDPAWKLSGGDGNFQLFTSCQANSSEGGRGFVCPQIVDGYGILYKINTDSIILVPTSFETSDFTNLDSFVENLLWAFERLEPLMPELLSEQKAKI